MLCPIMTGLCYFISFYARATSFFDQQTHGLALQYSESNDCKSQIRFYLNCNLEIVAEMVVGIGSYPLDLIYSVH